MQLIIAVKQVNSGGSMEPTGRAYSLSTAPDCHTTHHIHINSKKKVGFLTALKSSKSLSSLSVPKAAIRC